MAKLPKKIKVMFRDYDICESTPVDQISHGAHYGMFMNAEGKILVGNVSPAENANTVLHEALHAIWRHMSMDKDIEEHYVTLIANGLATLIRDNPKLFPAIQEMLNGN